MEQHEQLRGLLDGERLTSIGGALIPIPAAPAPAVGAFGALVTLLRFQPALGKEHEPQLMGRKTSRVLTASVFSGNANAAGPLVGVVQWGAGHGAQQQCEFDITSSLYQPSITATTAGGTLLSVPATSLQISARNDSNLLPRAGDTPLGNTVNVPVATAGFAIGHRSSTAQLTRTIYAVNLPTGAPFAPTNHVDIGIPAFAQRFRIFRSSALNAVQVQLLGTGGIFAIVSGPYIDAASVAPSLYTLPANAQIMRLTNNGPGNIDVLGVVFELGL
jgi:hypothetical protein